MRQPRFVHFYRRNVLSFSLLLSAAFSPSLVGPLLATSLMGNVPCCVVRTILWSMRCIDVGLMWWRIVCFSLASHSSSSSAAPSADPSVAAAAGRCCRHTSCRVHCRGL